MDKLRQVGKYTLLLRRWSPLALSIFTPLILLALIMLSASTAEAEWSNQAAPVITGIVTNPDGSPISGDAWVCLYYIDSEEEWWEVDCTDAWGTASEGDGSFEFPTPDQYTPGDFVVTVEAPWDSPFFDALPEYFFLEATGLSYDLGPIPLTYASFAGTVYNPDESLADGGWVSVQEMMNGGEWDSVAGADYYTGSYEIGGVPDGEGYQLLAYPPDDSILWHSEPISVSVAPESQYDPGATQEYDLFLQDPNLSGWVLYPNEDPVTWVYDEWEDPIGWAWVNAENEFGYYGNNTASSGEFGLLLPPGEYEVWADPEGTVAEEHTRSIPQLITLSEPASVQQLAQAEEILMLTYPSFEGWVYDPYGNPISDCLSVWLEDMEGNWMTDYWYCGGDDFPYRLGGVPAGEYWLMTDGLPEYGLFPPEPIPVGVEADTQYTPNGTQFIDIYLVEGQVGQLEVLVVDPTDNPVDAHVHLWNDWLGYWNESDSTPGAPALFEYLEGGEYQVQAWPMGYDIPELANSMVEWVYIGDSPTSITLMLQVPDITGVVETPKGNPLPQAYDVWGDPYPPSEINVHNDDWSVDIYLETNMDGEFSLVLPYHDHYTLLAYPMWETNLAISYTKSLPVEFFAPDGTVPQADLGSVRLTYPRVWGWVIGPDDIPVSAWVDVWNDDWSYTDGTETYWYDPDELYQPFRLGGMPDGHYFVRSGPPYDNTTGLGSSNIEEFDVAPESWYDPSSTEQITLYIGIANVIGELRYPLDSNCPDCPVPWIEVGIHDEDWMHYEDWTETGEDGRFTFSGLEPGFTYTVEVFLPDELLLDWMPPEPWSFFLDSPDQQEEAVLYLQPFECIKFAFGTVLYKDGTAVDDALVYAYHEDSGRWADQPTDEFGEYELCLEAGLWRMGVEPIYDATTPPDWWFDPDWEQWVWFTPTQEIDEQEVNFTILRHNEADFFQVTGVVTTPTGTPIPAGVAGIDLCSEAGECFGGSVESNGDFSFWAPPGTYEAWVWVEVIAGISFPFGEPLDNGRLVDVDEDPEDIGIFKLRATADRTAQVSGRVIVSGTGQGLAGVEVEAWTEDDYASTDTITGGHYTLKLFPGYWEGGPLLTPLQEKSYLVLPPQYKSGYLAAGETISNVNFYLQRRNATIRGRVVDEDGDPITEVDAVVFAEYCTNHECWTAGEDKVQGGSFELKVVGGKVYTLGVWLLTGGYMPGPPTRVEVAAGETKTGVLLTLLDAGTRIHGYLLDRDLNRVQINASVYGTDSAGNWVEDSLTPEKDTYNLYVPTPETDPVTWTLRLGVNPKTGYIADPSHPRYRVVIHPGDESVPNIMYVMELDTEIVGTVRVGTADGASAANVEVFAQGVKDTDSAGLYFEATTNASGAFTMPVLPGKYMVGAHLPPNLAATNLPPTPKKWTSEADNPVNIVLLPKPTEKIEIVGTLLVSPTGALPNGTTIRVFGWSEDTGSSEISGTLGSEYHLPVTADTTWHVWAAYVNPANNDFYHCRERRVKVGNATVTGQDLLLERAFQLPGSQCWTVLPSQSRRLEFPRRADMLDLLPPMLTVKAGTFSDTVRICATPRAALPEGQRLIGLAYEMEARDNQGKLITENFNKQMRLEFYFDEDVLRTVPSYPYPSPADLLPAYYSTVYNQWIALDDAFVDEEDLFATGKLDHFSHFGIRANPGEEHTIYLPLILKNYGS